MSVLRVSCRGSAAWLICIFILNLVFAPVCVAGSKLPLNAKRQLQTLGSGHKVKVTLKDGTTVQGRLGAVDDSSFGLDQGKKKGISTISYGDVASLQRNELTTGEKIGLGVGIPVVAVGIVVGIEALRWEHGSSSLCPTSNPQCVLDLVRKPVR
jgi:hypothetical protein